MYKCIICRKKFKIRFFVENHTFYYNNTIHSKVDISIYLLYNENLFKRLTHQFVGLDYTQNIDKVKQVFINIQPKFTAALEFEVSNIEVCKKCIVLLDKI